MFSFFPQITTRYPVKTGNISFIFYLKICNFISSEIEKENAIKQVTKIIHYQKSNKFQALVLIIGKVTTPENHDACYFEIVSPSW